jgi:uncharacterized membrane protein YfcA
MVLDGNQVAAFPFNRFFGYGSPLLEPVTVSVSWLQSMDIPALLVFLSVVALGSYIQTVTGFALGLVVMGAVTLLNLAPVAMVAIVISLLALVNSFLALLKQGHTVDWLSVRWIVAGLVPAVFIGLMLLDYLSNNSVATLKKLLGIFIVCSGLLLVYRPHPKPVPDRQIRFFAIGAIGGLFGGLFSTGGPPIVFHLYRQPMRVEVVRTTLLAIFIVATIVRIGYVGLRGEFSWPAVRLALYAMPMVLLFTWVGKRYRPPLSDHAMRRVAFGLLILLGLMLLVPGPMATGA